MTEIPKSHKETPFKERIMQERKTQAKKGHITGIGKKNDATSDAKHHDVSEKDRRSFRFFPSTKDFFLDSKKTTAKRTLHLAYISCVYATPGDTYCSSGYLHFWQSP